MIRVAYADAGSLHRGYLRHKEKPSESCGGPGARAEPSIIAAADTIAPYRKTPAKGSQGDPGSIRNIPLGQLLGPHSSYRLAGLWCLCLRCLCLSPPGCRGKGLLRLNEKLEFRCQIRLEILTDKKMSPMVTESVQKNYVICLR